MSISGTVEAKQHEIQHLLLGLDHLGQNFGSNRDIYYTLGWYLGYTDTLLLQIESQNDPLSWILTTTCVKTSSLYIADFVSNLEQFFIQYGHWNTFRDFINCNGFSSLLTSSYWWWYWYYGETFTGLAKVSTRF